MSSPTQRSLKLLRDQGYPAQVVEKWIAQARKRVDLFGVIDIVAIDGLPGVLGVQTTTASNIRARVKKASNIPEMVAWLEAGNRLHFHGWKKSRLTKRWECVIILAALDRGEFITSVDFKE